jgi:large subunit ribosomal protein L7Ae
MDKKEPKNAKAAKSAKVAKAAEPAKAAKVAKAADSAKTAKTAKTAKAAKVSKSANATKVAKSGKSKAGKTTKDKSEKVKKVHRHHRSVSNPLFEKKTKIFAIGRDFNTHKDLTRYVKWPRYIRRQRQRRILYSRLKVPPAINQFSQTLDKNTAIEAFKLLLKYKPESKKERKARLILRAKAIVERRKAISAFRKKVSKHIKETRAKSRADKKGKEKTLSARFKMDKKDHKIKPNFPAVPTKRTRKYAVKYGINHITGLVESKRAKIVFIANDVDPIELVVWLPALCKKMQVPYCIVKNKARLGKLVGKKTATAVALTEVEPEHKDVLANLIEAVRKNYNEKYEDTRKNWGGGVMGLKSRHAAKKEGRSYCR